MSSFADFTLATDRLDLRPLVEADAPALFTIFSDPEVMAYWSTPPWSALQTALEQISRDRRAMAVDEALRLGVFRREDGRLLGQCTLFHFDSRCRRAEIGYGLGHFAWGQGYAREALAALIGQAFGILGLNRIEADVDPRNEPSARLLERLGFAFEGRLRERWIVNGQVSDSVIYGLLASDPVRGR